MSEIFGQIRREYPSLRSQTQIILPLSATPPDSSHTKTQKPFLDAEDTLSHA